MKAYFILLIGMLLQTNTLFSQWTPTGGPYGDVNVLSLINADSFLLGVTRCGYFSKKQLNNEWTFNSTFQFSCYTKMGDSLFVGTNYEGIKLIYLRNLNDPPIEISTYSPKALAHYGTTLYRGDESYGFFKSINYGHSWTPFNLGLPIDTFPSSPNGPFSLINVSGIKVINNYIFCATSQGVYRNTVDLNNSWVEVNSGLPSTLVTLIEQFNDTLFATFSNKLFRSVDFGNTWELIHTATSKITAILQANNSIYLGTEGTGVYYSVNNGVNWSPLNGGLIDLNIHSLSSYDTKVLCGTSRDGVLYLQNDHWIKNESGMLCSSIRSMAVVNNNLICNDTNDVHKLDNNGNWQTISPVLAYNYLASLSSMDNTLFLSVGHITANYPFDHHFILYSLDSGITWDSLINPAPFVRDDAYRIYSENSKLYVFEDQFMYYTYDFGLTWTNISLPTQFCNNFSGFIVNNDILFVSTCEVGQILKLDDSDNWVLSNNGLPPNSYLNAFAKCDNTLLAYINNHGLYESQNNGAIWNSLNNGIITNYGIRGFVNTGSQLFVTNGNGVFGSNDCGQNWVSITTGLENLELGSIVISDDTLFVATYGRGVWKRGLTEISFESQENPIMDSLVIYPNPASDFIHVTTESKQGRFRIVDVLGRIVLSGNLNSNSRIDCSNIRSGMYMVIVDVEEKNLKSKLIIKR